MAGRGKDTQEFKRKVFRESFFSTLLPPPNLTGVLHLGHMWNAILQDTLMRCHREILDEENCYWGIGVDHAGISFQIKAQEEFRKEKGRDPVEGDGFLEWMEGLAERRKKHIVGQYDSLGYFDFGRDQLRYTLDDDSVKFCVDAFRELFSRGLIYRAHKLVNWDSELKTAISDAEIQYKEVKSKLYTVKYFYSEDEYIPVATSRPETIFGDIAVFVHPEDERYKHLIGREVRVPLTERMVKVMADGYVDPEFGSGAMKCTPAHDVNDGKLGDKYQLEAIQVFDEDLKMIMGSYAGMSHMEARGKVVEELEEKGLLEKVEDYVTNVSYSARSGGLVETLLSTQWFLRSSQMAYETWMYWRDHRHEMKMVNESHRGRLESLFKGTEDWCISRQVVWGIRIPAYVNEKSGEVSMEPRDGFVACSDVLDTWFSSSLWPLILKKPDLFPFTVVISGRDILLFWIARMVFMCYSLRNQLPFQKIFLHGLVLDDKRRKMSKSLNNGVEPAVLLEKYGSGDTARLFFLSNTRDANDIALDWSKLDGFYRVILKFENARNFVKKEAEGCDLSVKKEECKLMAYECVLLGELDSFYVDFFANLRELNFARAVDKMISFFRDKFCGQFLETYKVFQMKSRSEDRVRVLCHAWDRAMTAFRIIIPDFAEKAYIGSCALELRDVSESSYQLSWWFEYLKIFRELKKTLGIPSGQLIRTRIYVDHESKYHGFRDYLGQLNHEVEFVGSISERSLGKLKSNSIVIPIYLNSARMVLELELTEEMAKLYNVGLVNKAKWLRKEIAFLSNRLRGFNYNTPKDLKRETQEKLSRYEEDLEFYVANYGI